MMNKLSLCAAVAIAIAGATVANAQDADGSVPVATVYAGPSVGYHNLGVSGVSDDDGIIYGGVLGFELPVGDTVNVGLEGNYHLGTNAIDRDYGVAAKLGFDVSESAEVFVKGGYQWVNFDLGNFGGAGLGLDDTDGDYLVGVGGEFGLGEGPIRIRAGVDTISFDTIRATAGLIYNF